MASAEEKIVREILKIDLWSVCDQIGRLRSIQL